LRNCFQKIYRVVSEIPEGSVLTYKEVAIKAKIKDGWRVVGMALKKNKKPLIIPCHRVIKSDGSIGGYSGGIKKKIKLLKSEGLKIVKKKGKWMVKK